MTRKATGRLNSGNDLLSRALETHYHRRCRVSLPGSRWDRVGPRLSGHQTTVPLGGNSPPGKGRLLTASCCQRTPRGFPGNCAGDKGFSTFKSRRNWEEFHLRLVANQKNSVNCPPAIRNRKEPDRIAENPEIKPIGKLVSLSSTRYRASTRDLSTWWSTTSLMGKCHLRMGLALRCFQRLSLPHIATRRCRGRDNRNTRGASFPVLSY